MYNLRGEKIIINTTEKLNQYLNNCPQRYPCNNELRRQHKHTIGRKLRYKRELEIRNYLLNSYCFEFVEHEINKQIKENINENYLNFVDYREIEPEVENEFAICLCNKPILEHIIKQEQRRILK